MKKTIIWLIVISLFSKIMGFGREIILAYFYGASNISDAYIISMTVPNLAVTIIGSSIIASYIPLYTKLESRESISRAQQYTSSLINILMLGCLIIVGLGLIYTEQIIGVVASGFNEQTMNLAIKMTKVTFFGVFLSSLISVLQSYLQIKNDYLTPSLIGIPFDLVTVVSIILSSYSNTMVMAYGYLAAKSIQVIFLYISSKKKQLTYSFKIDFKDPELKNMLLLALPVIIGLAVNDVNHIIDKTLASQIAVGGISALNYAQKLNGVVQGVIVASIGTVMYPLISKLAMKDNVKGLKNVLSESIVGTSALILPSMMGIMFLSKPIILFLFGRGAFESSAIEMTSNALFYYSFGMIGIGMREILSKPFYALEDTKTPMKNSIVGIGVNILLNIVLSRFLEISGLALATSISAILTAILMYVSLHKRIGSFQMKSMKNSLTKIFVASLSMAATVRVCFNLLSKVGSNNISLIIAILIGVIVYFIFLRLSKIRELDVVFLSIMKKRPKWLKKK